jgi:hypothetical protein
MRAQRKEFFTTGIVTAKIEAGIVPCEIPTAGSYRELHYLPQPFLLCVAFILWRCVGTGDPARPTGQVARFHTRLCYAALHDAGFRPSKAFSLRQG